MNIQKIDVDHYDTGQAVCPHCFKLIVLYAVKSRQKRSGILVKIKCQCGCAFSVTTPLESSKSDAREGAAA
jgi:hypothetical protein